ncbi:MAG: alanyl-tRNA editing protein [Spirochaetes bacterium]|nr:alanyl-tRNA editing protein [Spirochaetota bacterium]
MHTIPLYYAEPSTFAFTAVIAERIDIDGKHAVILDRSAFYPEGGGQPCDLGTIGGVPVEAVFEEGGRIVHVLSGELGGEGPVECAVNGTRRRDHAEQHTGQHLLSAVFSSLMGAETVGFHLGEAYSTIDLAVSPLDDDALIRVEDEVDVLVSANLPVIVHECGPADAARMPLRKAPPEGEENLRIVEIAGTDFSPCCGTHLDSTQAIRSLCIVRAEKNKDCQRVIFVAGRRAFSERRKAAVLLARVARVFACSDSETPGKAASALARISGLEAGLKRVRSERATAEAALAAPGRLVSRNWPDRPFDEALESARALLKAGAGLVVFYSGPEMKVAALAGDAAFALSTTLKPLSDAAGGRGGGGGSLFQASFATREAAARFASEAERALGSRLAGSSA